MFTAPVSSAKYFTEIVEKMHTHNLTSEMQDSVTAFL